MAGRTTASEIIVIHARKIIVYQRVGVNAFKRTRERKRIIDLAAASFSGSQAQNRPQTFAAGKQTVAHSPVKRRGLSVRLGQIAVQRAVDQLLASDEIVFEIHVAKRLLSCWIVDTRYATERRVSSSIRINVVPHYYNVMIAA